ESFPVGRSPDRAAEHLGTESQGLLVPPDRFGFGRVRAVCRRDAARPKCSCRQTVAQLPWPPKPSCSLKEDGVTIRGPLQALRRRFNDRFAPASAFRQRRRRTSVGCLVVLPGCTTRLGVT